MNQHPLLIKGVEEFNKREFFEAHETLEDYWNTLSGDEKELVQSIIQAAVAYYHFGRGNLVGARKLLTRAIARAESVDSNTLNINVCSYLEKIRISLRDVENEGKSIELASITFST
jgi:hypothetical protein